MLATFQSAYNTIFRQVEARCLKTVSASPPTYGLNLSGQIWYIYWVDYIILTCDLEQSVQSIQSCLHLRKYVRVFFTDLILYRKSYFLLLFVFNHFRC